jgi:hypothetical protein
MTSLAPSLRKPWIMAFGLQVRKIQELLVTSGLDPDKYDLEQILDRRLTYPEQKLQLIRNIKITKPQPGVEEIDRRYNDWLREQEMKDPGVIPGWVPHLKLSIVEEVIPE